MKIATVSAAVAVFISASVSAGAADPALSPAAERVRADITFLSDDLLEGRKTGTNGHEVAARFVAARFASLGLKPAGDNGSYFQRITFQRTYASGSPGTVTIKGPGGTRTWAHATDVLVGVNGAELDYDITAPLVFVGYGIQNNRLGIDDYRGLDVAGKIVVALAGYPEDLPSEEGAHLSATKYIAAAKRGAIGFVTIPTQLSAKTRPWVSRLRYADEASFAWVGADGKPYDPAPEIRGSASLNDPAAAAAFSGAPRTFEAVRVEVAKRGGRPKGFALKTTIRIANHAKSERVTSPNVVAILPGSDPTLASQYVILSGHLDHLGIDADEAGTATARDRINNGALDNAAGVATMLEVARAASAAAQRPRRSLIFLASTAEEDGLLGADYHARHPAVPIANIVGNVDLDMPMLLYPFTDVVAFGADHSTIGPLTAAAVAPMDIKLSPDPMPEQGIFTRSDHYMFVRQGVPAVFLATGYANGGKDQWQDYLTKTYHHPGDDVLQAIHWESGARFAEANYRIMRAMADADSPPLWFEDDFFGDEFAPGRPRAKR